MRILYCNKYNFRFSGTEAYLFDLMQRIAAQGHEVALFSMADPRGETWPHERFFVKTVDFKDSRGWLKRARLAAHAVYSWEARKKLGALIAEFKPDVAHVRNIYHHLSPSIFWELKKRGVPVIYHVNDFKLLCPNYNLVAHGNVCERCGRGRYWQCVRTGCYSGGRLAASVLATEAYVHRWLRTYEDCVDLILAPSEFVRDKLVEHGWPKARLEVLPHFQAVQDEYTPPSCANAPVLYFGRLSSEKGLRPLLLAMARNRQIPLLVAGDGPQCAELESLRDELALNNVTFAGHLSGRNLTDAICASRFTVFPSQAYETLGKSILESYALGRAVVASDMGSRREFVHEGKTGLLFPPGDVGEMAKALASLYAEPARSEAMGRAGQELLRTKHSPEQHCATVIRLYSEVRGRRRKSLGEQSGNRARPARLRVAFIGGRGVLGKYSGIEAYYEEVGRRLAQRGHDVTVYCRTYFTPAIEHHGGMRLVRLPTIRTKHLETLVHTALSTAHALTQGYHAVHYHTLGPALFSWIPRLAGSKTAVTVQGLDWQRKKWGKFAAWVLRAGERAAVQFPNSTMVVSRTLQDYYRRQHGAETVFIPNGAQTRARSPVREILQWRLAPGQYVLYLGRFSPEKNCHLLVRAFETMDLPATQLVMAGGAKYADEYAAELGRHASDRVRLLDYVSGTGLDELLTNAMLFVLPSDLEGLSLALLEAMGAGLCVLASDIPENREVVEGAGYLFRSGDVADLAEKLRFLVNSPEARAEAGRRAQERIRAHYDWDKITANIEREYERVIEDAGGIATAKDEHARVKTGQNRGEAA